MTHPQVVPKCGFQKKIKKNLYLPLHLVTLGRFSFEIFLKNKIDFLFCFEMFVS
jgi:hypothetical protein